MSIQMKFSDKHAFQGMTHTPLAVVLSCLLATAPQVLADDGPTVVDEEVRTSQVLRAPTFDQVDADGSGELSAEELASYYQQQLDKNGWTDEQVVSRYDANASGGLNPPEYEQLLSTMLDQHIADMKNSAQQRQMKTETEMQASAGEMRTTNDNSMQGSDDAPRGFQAGESVTISEAKQLQPDQLDGLDVVNRNGDDIGEVEKVITENGRVTEVVVSVGGLLGIGDKEVLVDADNLQVTGNKVVWNTPMDKDAIDNLPEYKEGDKLSSSGH
ncbi:PRC-barrel domain-containing protein [Gilvimarinus agarilyticus]|uniref:PRC-barrel domain-containing protein n=1 Tax=Gilvimarinus agarilyticus TaxID=679259 RepID=UPI000696399A|nr:PRC-barrel domain-containing protein [Gilvimarinus agarilyticus]